MKPQNTTSHVRAAALPNHAHVSHDGSECPCQDKRTPRAGIGGRHNCRVPVVPWQPSKHTMIIFDSNSASWRARICSAVRTVHTDVAVGGAPRLLSS